MMANENLKKLFSALWDFCLGANIVILKLKNETCLNFNVNMPRKIFSFPLGT